MRKNLSVALAAMMSLSMILSSCGTKSSTTDKTTDSTTTSTTTQSEELSFPLKEKITLTNWMPFSSTLIKNLNENVVYQELEKMTNIHMDFIHVTNGQEKEQFNLMLASNDLPDIIQYADHNYPGGADKAIEDKVFLRLNELIDKYAINYKAIRESNPNIAKQTITDAGNIYAFNCIQKMEEQSWCGTVIRQDWLDELGLTMPKSIEDWHTVLKAFKEKKNVEIPLVFNGLGWMMDASSSLVSAFNVTNNFMNQDGTVKYGVIEPGYKEFLTTMNQWYNEGIIDKDFTTRDWKSDDALFTSGKTGAMFAPYGSFDSYTNAGKQVDPKFKLAGVANVPKTAGEPVHFRQTNTYNKGSDSMITSANKYPKETAMWLDLGYTEKGFLLYNYGVEGVSWNWADGSVSDIDKGYFPDSIANGNKHPAFTDLMLKNPDGIPFGDLVAKYKVHQNASLRNPMANGASPEVIQAMTEWSKPGNDWVMPPLSLTNEENQKKSAIMTEINTFVSEQQLKFILGIIPISEFDNFVAQVKKMGIDEVVQIQQAGLDRYINRK